MTKFIDTHTHLNFKDFEKDRFSIIENCLLNQISMINVGTTFNNSKTAVLIAEKYAYGVYASLGVHPLNVEKEEFDFKELLESKKVVAIGETGLDYFYENFNKEKQKKYFLKHIELARKIDLPLIVHSRKAFEDTYEILKDKNVKGVLHCFTGNLNYLKRFLDLGFYIGFNGIIFKMNLDKIIENTPKDRILIETDCPYLTPPLFYEERNNPLGVKFVMDKINEIKGEDISKEVYCNSLKLFKI